jgi:hypothetical protein
LTFKLNQNEFFQSFNILLVEILFQLIKNHKALLVSDAAEWECLYHE